MRFFDNEEITNYVNLFVSVIICFPEVTTIKYDRGQDEIYFNFILKEVTHKEKLNQSLHKIEKAFRKFRELEHKLTYEFTINVIEAGNYAILEARRDMQSVSREEITFLVELFKETFGKQLLIESGILEDESDFRWFQQEDSTEIDEKRKIKFDEKSIGNNILVCRESGKVLVFSNS